MWTKPAIPVFLYDYFFFLPTFFAAFFFAAMFITSDRFMEFHSAIFADGVIYLTDWLYEEMPGDGNDYFTDTFPVGLKAGERSGGCCRIKCTNSAKSINGLG